MLRIIFPALLFSILGFNGVLADNEKLWPDLTCHPLYDPEILTKLKDFCEEVLAPDSKDNQDRHLSTMKGCVVHFLPLLYIKIQETGNSYGWFTEKQTEHLKKNLYLTLANSKTSGATPEKIKEGEALADKIFMDLLTCKPTWTEVYDEKKLPDSQWDLLFACVDKAMGCAK